MFNKTLHFPTYRWIVLENKEYLRQGFIYAPDNCPTVYQ